MRDDLFIDSAEILCHSDEDLSIDKTGFLNIAAESSDKVFCFVRGGPRDASINDLVKVAGANWAIKDLFELFKGG